jgi:3-(3-hydroxy-phenyl)propionate hydroxylase
MEQVLPSCDVVVIGLGPTGLVLANLLGQRGWSVAGFERDADVYYAPRAVHFDDEVMRIFQKAGLHEEMSRCCEPFQYMEMILKPGGKPIFRGKVGVQDRRNGYAGAWWFHQPTLERHLRAGIERYSQVIPYYGAEVTGIVQDDSGVTVTATTSDGQARSVRARFAIGCDGGRSFTRKTAGLQFDSADFDEAWVVVDTRTRSGAKEADLPANHFQCCDPKQPVTYVPLAGPYYEWQFMVTDGKPEREATDPAYVRRKLRAFADLSRLEIIRIAYYRFHALWARKWSNGRIVLAGDSAHQMPPFLGQGMCSGIRDAESLSWRLDLALKGYDYRRLLDEYQRERSAHVRHIIQGAMFLGNRIQTRSRFMAVLRNNLVLRPAHWVPVLNRLFLWVANRKRPLEEGFFGKTRRRCAGRLFPQPVVACVDGSAKLLDEIMGPGFAIVARNSAIAALPPDVRELAARLPLRLVTFAATPQAGVVGDQSGVLDKWFASAKADFALVRPDRYVYDAGRADQLGAILQNFLAALPARESAQVAA